MATSIDRSVCNLETLADCYRRHVDIWAWCEVEAAKCYRSAKLDLLATIGTYGDLEVTEVKRRLTCMVCGRRSHSLKLVHVGRPLQPRRELPTARPMRRAAE